VRSSAGALASPPMRTHPPNSALCPCRSTRTGRLVSVTRHQRSSATRARACAQTHTRTYTPLVFVKQGVYWAKGPTAIQSSAQWEGNTSLQADAARHTALAPFAERVSVPQCGGGGIRRGDSRRLLRRWNAPHHSQRRMRIQALNARLDHRRLPGGMDGPSGWRVEEDWSLRQRSWGHVP
jgi:hypothetical protein